MSQERLLDRTNPEQTVGKMLRSHSLGLAIDESLYLVLMGIHSGQTHNAMSRIRFRARAWLRRVDATLALSFPYHLGNRPRRQ